jgi:hypothetical protein
MQKERCNGKSLTLLLYMHLLKFCAKPSGLCMSRNKHFANVHARMLLNHARNGLEPLQLIGQNRFDEGM